MREGGVDTHVTRDANEVLSSFNLQIVSTCRDVIRRELEHSFTSLRKVKTQKRRFIHQHVPSARKNQLCT
jgi:hypothetical protein